MPRTGRKAPASTCAWCSISDAGTGLLIQCVGNRLLGDDAAGPMVAGRLRQRTLPRGVEVKEYWGEGSKLLQDWEAAARVFLVDCACSGAATGTLHRIDLTRRALPAGFCYHGSHRFGVAEAVETGRALGRLPREIRLFAIEGKDFRLGAPPSRAVTEAVETLAEELAQLAGPAEDDHA